MDSCSLRVGLIDPGDDLGEVHLAETAPLEEEEAPGPLGERVAVDVVGRGKGIHLFDFTSVPL